MKQIKKAVIPVAGFGTRFLPFTKAMPKEMLPLVDKPTIQYIVEEAVASGITEILFITAAHSNKRAIEDHFDHNEVLTQMLTKKDKLDLLQEVDKFNDINFYYIRQKEPKGLGDAILCAKEFINNEPFCVLLGDDVVVSDNPAIKQLIVAYNEVNASIIGVQNVEANQIDKYGIVIADNGQSLVKIDDIIEKPAIGSVSSTKAALGRYILSPTIFKYLATQERGAGNEVQLTDAIKRMMEEEAVYACNFTGKRYDIGDKLGFIKATIDFSLQRADLHDDVLEYIKDITKKG